ncbi:hypothetical protein GL263_15665 [Streptomyces durbertensis]|uniref:Uncharacterized protein n=1 Tax=Streptomyces durbertensis TaxID=2448886 RepID=A0ABR6EKF6_9ACTN|nr:hypothetical protein [Streptomyces durbertensis]MBB1244994.1 hypothetical protein [Streptomyces durbertensis]
MNTPGTINRPFPHGTTKQDSMTAPIHDTSLNDRSDKAGITLNRNREMQLLPESLSRSHMQDRLYEAESQRPAQRLLAARRMQRKAERASRRARRALAMALMQ